jgi:hypothetical protein
MGSGRGSKNLLRWRAEGLAPPPTPHPHTHPHRPTHPHTTYPHPHSTPHRTTPFAHVWSDNTSISLIWSHWASVSYLWTCRYRPTSDSVQIIFSMPPKEVMPSNLAHSGLVERAPIAAVSSPTLMETFWNLSSQQSTLTVTMTPVTRIGSTNSSCNQGCT